MAIKRFKQFEENKLTQIINKHDDFDRQNYEFAKWIFQKEEGREPNMNNDKDMNAVAIIEVGVRYTRNYSK
jgi:hypothetical protein